MGHVLIAEETARLWCRKAALIAEGERADSEEKTAYVNLGRIAIETATMEAMRLIQRSLGLTAFLEPNPIERPEIPAVAALNRLRWVAPANRVLLGGCTRRRHEVQRADCRVTLPILRIGCSAPPSLVSVKVSRATLMHD
jgi:hypothetical protein